MPPADLFVSTAVLDGGPALGKEEVVGRLVSLLAQAGHIPQADVPAIRAAVLRREQLGSTGIGRGVAIPHTKHAAVDRPTGILSVWREPVEFDALDGEPVDIVALILFPPGRPTTWARRRGGRRGCPACWPTRTSAGGCGGPARRGRSRTWCRWRAGA